MKPMFYSEAKFPPTLEEIRRYESVAGEEIPADIKRFLVGLPGTWPFRDMLTLSENVIRAFHFGFLWDYPEGRLIRDGKSCCLVFAGGKGGHIFGIELTDSDRGGVYLRQRERGKPGRIMGKVADSLDMLLELLEEDPKSDFWDHYKRYDDGGPDWVLQTYREFEEYLPTDAEFLQRSNPSLLVDLELTDTGPGISKEYLDWIECGFRIRLPLDIRKFYSMHNGGRPVKRLIESEGKAVDVKLFSMERSLNGEPPAWKSGVFVESVKMSKYRGDRLLPSHMWPLGYTGIYCELAFSTARNDFGSIWLTTVHSEVRPIKVADSFAEFVANTWKVP